MNETSKPPSIVVGIDGSKAAVHAALWAVDEAVSRDIPLRLLYAIEPDPARPAGLGGPQTGRCGERGSLRIHGSRGRRQAGEDRSRNHPGAGDHLVDPSFGVGRHGMHRGGRGAPFPARAGGVHRCGRCGFGPLPGGYHPGPRRSGRAARALDRRRRARCCRQRGFARDGDRGSATEQFAATGNQLSTNTDTQRRRIRGWRPSDRCQP